MDIYTTITKPWREPVDYLTLVFWVLIFVIVAFAMFDTMRVLATWVKNTAT